MTNDSLKTLKPGDIMENVSGARLNIPRYLVFIRYECSFLIAHCSEWKHWQFHMDADPEDSKFDDKAVAETPILIRTGKRVNLADVIKDIVGAENDKGVKDE